MRMLLSGVAALVVCGSSAVASAQPALVTLGPAGAGTREIGISYSGWSLSTGRTASAGAARYTYNLGEAVGIEGEVGVGSVAHRAFASGAMQIRLMAPRSGYDAAKFFTFGVMRVAAPPERAPSGFARSLGMGLQQPVSGDMALRFEGQLLMFKGQAAGLRLALTVVAGKG